MEFTKFELETNTNEVHLFLPIQKVDKERRTVTGFATLDNLDKHDDIVRAEASREAFASFRGNIREMHMPKAVGRMVNFTEKSYMDPETGEDYDGIYVEVYVSKGAQDTWEKVLDGTLNGFSIGGAIIEASPVEKSDGKKVREITKYALNELSLVDSPANQFANVFSIQKNEQGLMEVTGFATEDEAETATVVEDPYMSRMEKFFDKLENVFEKTFGGNDMTTKAEETETAVEEVVDTDTEEVVEKAADVSEVEVSDTPTTDLDIESLADSVVEKVLERLSKSDEEPVEVEDEVQTEDLSEIEKSLDENKEVLASITKAIDEFKTAVEELKSETNERLEALEDASAVKKSTGTGGNLKKTAENTDDFWGGSALGGTNTDA